MESSVEGSDGRIAFVQSCWHRDIVDECRDSFLAELARARRARVRRLTASR